MGHREGGGVGGLVGRHWWGVVGGRWEGNQHNEVVLLLVSFVACPKRDPN